MRIFIWPLIFTIILLVAFSITATPFIRHHVAHNLPVHKTLYLDRTMIDEEFFHFVEAAIEWNDATDGQVIFDVKRLPQKNINPLDAIIIMDVTPDFPDIILMDNIGSYDTLGVFGNEHGLANIIMVVERIEDAQYTPVVMHELGHSLGLEHIQGADGIGTLMFPNIEGGSSHLTDRDLAQLCKLYHTDCSRFHGK